LSEEDDDETISDDPSKKKKKRSRTPFILKILKFNAPEWPWILLGSTCSIIYGATQPIFALFYSYIYGLFAEPDLEKQKHLTSIYAGVIFVIGFSGGLALFLSTVGFAKSGEALTMRMRKLTFAAMLRQEIGYFDQESNSVGALITRLSSDASSLKVNHILTNICFFNEIYLFTGFDWCSHWYHTSSNKCCSNCSCYCISIWLEIIICCLMFCSSNDV